MYRPTLRCADTYRDYIDELFRLTGLDRNKIIRCCIFTSAFNPEFIKILEEYKHPDVPLPSSYWAKNDHYLWLEPGDNAKKGGEVTNVNMYRKTATTEVTKLHEKPRGSNGISTSTKKNEGKEKKLPGRKPSPSGPARALPSIRLHGNGGIKLDFR